jgi:hypothetical protein
MPFASDWDDESPAFWAESENAEKKKKKKHSSFTLRITAPEALG